MKTEYIELINLSKKASSNAYAPYSKFKVGAAVMFEDGNIYQGCNVENVSYGLALCAERNAVSSAIAQGQKGLIKAIAITSPDSPLCYPCGACLQWLSEFKCTQDIDVILEDSQQNVKMLKLSELLPYQFEKNRLI